MVPFEISPKPVQAAKIMGQIALVKIVSLSSCGHTVQKKFKKGKTILNSY